MLGSSMESCRTDGDAVCKTGQPFIRELRPSINGFAAIWGRENRIYVVFFFFGNLSKMQQNHPVVKLNLAITFYVIDEFSIILHSKHQSVGLLKRNARIHDSISQFVSFSMPTPDNSTASFCMLILLSYSSHSSFVSRISSPESYKIFAIYPIIFMYSFVFIFIYIVHSAAAAAAVAAALCIAIKWIDR